METVALTPKYNLNEEQEKKVNLTGIPCPVTLPENPHQTRRSKKLIRHAFEMAADAHKTMRRKSGEPYILHPWPWPGFAWKRSAWVCALPFVPCCTIPLKIPISHSKILNGNLALRSRAS